MPPASKPRSAEPRSRPDSAGHAAPAVAHAGRPGDRSGHVPGSHRSTTRSPATGHRRPATLDATCLRSARSPAPSPTSTSPSRRTSSHSRTPRAPAAGRRRGGGDGQVPPYLRTPVGRHGGRRADRTGVDLRQTPQPTRRRSLLTAVSNWRELFRRACRGCAATQPPPGARRLRACPRTGNAGRRAPGSRPEGAVGGRHRGGR